MMTAALKTAAPKVSLLKPVLFHRAEAALEILLSFAYPADTTLSRYFRSNPGMGHTERGIVAEASFSVLRHLRTLRARAELEGGRATPRRLLLAALSCEGRNLRELEPLLKKDEAIWLASVKRFDDAALSPAARRNLPDWLSERLDAEYGEAADALIRALNQSAPLDMRVNLLKTTREDALAAFAADGILARPGEHAPFALRLTGKPDVSRHPLFLQGQVEVQDEGSQLLGLLLAPRRGEAVADFCAGAGGKTLLLGMLMRNTGRLYAFDVSEKRLEKLKPRLARSGLSNVHPVRIDSESDARLKRLRGKMDRVLVDAPCSGLGTLRRNPDLKWRQTPESVTELAARQRGILAAAARLVRPGGTLLYATCSLLREENEAVTESFLGESADFSLLETRRSLPHTHGTDGFYAALMRRA